MKSLIKVSVWIATMAICFIGCERWGGQIDNPDSDRPTDVGSEFGKRGNKGSTDKGTLYGDLLYILRHSNGTPVYNLEGFVQPLAFLDGEPFINEDGVQYLCAMNEEGEVEVNFYMDGDERVEHLGVGPLEVGFGRTNLFRAPQSVLDQALREAMNGLSEVDVETIQLDFCGRLFGVRADGSEKTIDSPRENFALYQSLIQNEGYNGICEVCMELNYQHLYDFFYSWNYNWMNVAAGCFAGANDKTGNVDVDKVEYVHSFKNLIGLNPIEDDMNKLYFNFGDFNGYDRSIWNDVKLGFLVWNGTYNETPAPENIFSVSDIFEGVIAEFGYGEQPNFTYNSMSSWFKSDNVGGFAQFIDDCNQVLEYVHEDSNIVWVRDE
ncbi:MULTISPECIES: hypothetical protein [unclassified Carboxylicivirga]|uniref:hypothetical protein n=1 Tax=Carboxylicivirga TaxID=1628153 RepID=UPI003D32C5D1